MNWKSPRKYLLLVNAIVFRYDKFFQRRDPHVWIFGAWEGKAYDDNSRCLYEYVCLHHKDEVRAVWLTHDDRCLEKIADKGHECYKIGTKEADEVERRAGVAVYTHGLVDFGYLPRVGGAYIVSLWHGVGFKKIYNDKYSGWSLMAKKCLDKVFSWTCRDLTTVTSEYTKRQFASIFGLKADAKIVITGQPRNDIFKSVDKTMVCNKIGVSDSKRLILYMPTYRGKAMGEHEMELIVTALYESEELENALQAFDAVLIVKPHPLTSRIKLKARADFMVLDYAAIENNQELLGASDMLITDYSSCAVDYALLHRPIVFYLPDHEQFIEQSEPLYGEFVDLCLKHSVNTIYDLSRAIATASKDACDELNSLYEAEEISGTNYTEHVYNAIVENYGKEKKGHKH